MAVTPRFGGYQGRARGLFGRGETLVANPVFAYGAVLVLQLRIIWNIWRYSDLTTGDTSSYFVDAISWTHGLHDNIVWSPFYTDFWGTIIAAFGGHPYSAEMAERMAIVLIAALLVLGIMRSLLHPAMALLVAVWWTVNPANFNPLYEVHLFGALPLFVALICVARAPSRRALGVGLAILLGTTLLLRNEVFIASAIFAVAIVIHERRGRRRTPVGLGTYARAYGIPLVLVCLLAGGLYWRSYVQGGQVSHALAVKSDLNLCQSYAFNYQQRHPTRFTGNPFTDCQPLMKQVFGRDEPSFVQATIADPRAMGAYVLWNARLLPSGVQVALFNATATSDQPDYPLVHTDRIYALVLTIVLLGVLLAGGLILRRELRARRREWLADFGWVLVMFAAVVATTLFVALSERPRPEYMYAMTVGIMALAGACGTALLRRARVMQYLAPAVIVLTVALCIVTPVYYRSAPRPLHDEVARLWPFRSRLDQPHAVLIASDYNFELCSYLAQDYSRECSSPSWTPLSTQIAAGGPVAKVLARANASVIYADTGLLSNPVVARMVTSPAAYGWRRAAGGVGAEGPWAILVRTG